MPPELLTPPVHTLLNISFIFLMHIIQCKSFFLCEPRIYLKTNTSLLILSQTGVGKSGEFVRLIETTTKTGKPAHLKDVVCFNQVRLFMEILWPVMLFMGLVWLRKVNPLYRQHECEQTVLRWKILAQPAETEKQYPLYLVQFVNVLIRLRSFPQ